jgi:ADP-ribose pyrophosphatase
VSNDPSYSVSETTTVHDGEVLAVRRDRLAMPDGSQANREVAVVDDAVAVVALDDRQRVCLVRQYRHPLRERLLELPAGKMDVRGESPLQTASRELEEETGLCAESWHELICFVNSGGWTTERTHILLAERVQSAAGTRFQATGEEADMEVLMVPLRDALRMIDAGEVTDAKTVVGLLLASRRLALLG